MSYPGNVEVLVDMIRPILADHGPDLQGAVIAELFALFIAGHPQKIREDIVQLWFDMALDLVDIYDGENSPKKIQKKIRQIQE